MYSGRSHYIPIRRIGTRIAASPSPPFVWAVRYALIIVLFGRVGPHYRKKQGPTDVGRALLEIKIVPLVAYANNSRITLPLLAIFIGRPLRLVKVVSKETPKALQTEAMTSCDV